MKSDAFEQAMKDFFYLLCDNGPWKKPDLSSTFQFQIWDKFCSENPRARAFPVIFQSQYKYELSTQQCGVTVGATMRIWED